MKEKICLDGQWRAALVMKEKEEKQEPQLWYEKKPDCDQVIDLPGTTAQAKLGEKGTGHESAHLSERYPMRGIAWFERTVELTEEQCRNRIELFLERSRITDVWVNGHYAGRQDSLAAPHVHDISGLAVPGTNRIEISVNNVDYPVPGGHLTSPDTQSNWNGIVGEISLRFYDMIWMDQVILNPSMKEKSLEIQVIPVGKLDQKSQIRILAEITSPSGEAEYFRNTWTGKTESLYMLCPITDPVGWEEHTPNLYHVKLIMQVYRTDEDEECSVTVAEDCWEGTCGFRDLSCTVRNFCINGHPVYLRGKHDGLTFPKTGYAPMTKTEWMKIFEIARSYGINHYRFHTCCPPEASFEAADEIGIYLQPELPFWGTIAEEGEEIYQEEAQNYLVQEGFRILRAFGNHPSFVAFSMGNELWGSVNELNRIIAGYKKEDQRHWYTEGSNNFQFSPQIAKEDDFYSGVRLSKDRLFRGSYAMCDAPQGRIQLEAPQTAWDYNEMIRPAKEEVLIPKIPVVSHEIGQYSMYPDYGDIEKYDGVLSADCLEEFRNRLDRAGMLPLADRFFKDSGALAVQCYKEELEAALRSKELAGFQVLDLQDFMGQGIAMVGILNAFLENKGVVTAETWREFCSDAVILARFDSYVRRSGETMALDCQCAWYRSCLSSGNQIRLQLKVLEQVVWEAAQDLDVFGENGLYDAGRFEVAFPQSDLPYEAVLEITLNAGQTFQNHYEFWVYPAIEEVNPANWSSICITSEKETAKQKLAAGMKVLYLPDRHPGEGRLESAYCTDFWNYPMFRSISENLKRKLPVGTLGLTINSGHPAFEKFPCRSFTTPQWFSIVEGAYPDILEKQPTAMLAQVIDNGERNHRLGLIYEEKDGKGHMIVCHGGLSALQKSDNAREALPVRWLLTSLLSYLLCDADCA